MMPASGSHFCSLSPPPRRTRSSPGATTAGGQPASIPDPVCGSLPHMLDGLAAAKAYRQYKVDKYVLSKYEEFLRKKRPAGMS